MANGPAATEHGHGHLVLITTTDSADAASTLAAGLVDQRLAACVQIVGPIISVYRWEGEIQNDTEWQCWVKTTVDRATEVTAWITENHSYDVPEVVALPVVGGSDAYLRWVTDETR